MPGADQSVQDIVTICDEILNETNPPIREQLLASKIVVQLAKIYGCSSGYPFVCINNLRLLRS